VTTTRPEPAEELPPQGVHWRSAPYLPPPAGVQQPIPPAVPLWQGPVPPFGPPRPGGPPKRTPWGWIIGGIAGGFVLLVVLILVAVVALVPRTMTVNGSVVVGGRGTLQPGMGCEMTSAAGRPVSIFGSDGRLVGSTSLTGTNGIAVNQWNSAQPGLADGCQFPFTLSGVDAEDTFYRVTLGSDIDNSVGFSRQQLETSGAHITYRW
jgi:hypothetical protein